MGPNHEPPATEGPAGPSSLLTASILITLGVIITAARLYTYSEPLERDLTTYAVFAHEMLAGKSLYTDLWNNYTPSIFLTYAAAELAVGYGPGQFFLLGLSAAFLTLTGVYCAAWGLGGRAAGLWAASLWAACSSDLMLQANQPNTEVFINACLTWAFAALVHLDPRARGGWRAFAIGGCFALATFYKPIVIFVPAALGLAHLVPSPGESSPRGGRAFRQVMVMALVGAVFWACVMGYFAATSRLQDFFEAVVSHNRAYSGSIVRNLAHSFEPGLALPRQLWFALPLFGLSALAILWGRRVEERGGGLFPVYPMTRERGLLLAYLMGVHFSIAGTGQYHNHYYQLWLPPLAIGAGWAVGTWGRSGRGSIAALARPVGLAVLVLLLAYESRNYRLSPEEWSRKKYGYSYIYIQSEGVGRQIGRLLEKGEEFYQCGNEVGLYYSSRRRPPANPVWWSHLVHSPAATRLRSQVLGQLERRRPELVVVCGPFFDQLPKDDPLRVWLAASYRPDPRLPRFKDFNLYVRINGALERRLMQGV